MNENPDRPSMRGGRELTTPEWADAFKDAFEQIDEDLLDGYRLLTVGALDELRVAVVYDDGTGRVTGRIFRAEDLNGSNRHRYGPVSTVSSFILGEIVEPSGPGLVDDDPVLKELNRRYPGIGWFGSLPRFDDDRGLTG